ncbi:MAG: hypothetical protein LBO81_00125 [Clostridiales Family XIII bacterium]|nr:hypothetical protein [Clostridiales Family XIII bacterium]
MRDDLRKEEMTMPGNRAKLRKVTVGLGLTGFILALIVFYALSLPALTLEPGELICELPEHTHGEACYGYALVPDGYDTATSGGALSFDPDVMVDLHTTDPAITLATPAPEGMHYEWVLVCELPEHTHSEDCYAEEAEEEAAEPAPEQMMRAMFGPLGDPLPPEGSKLENFITGFTIKDSESGVPIDNNGTVTVGKNYTIELRFEEKYIPDTVNEQFEYDANNNDNNAEGVLTYPSLPSAIKMANPDAIGNIMAEGTSTVVGYYKVDPVDGHLEVWFLDKNESGNDTDGTNFIDTSTTAKFTLQLQTLFNGDRHSEQVEVNFGTGITITLNVEADPEIGLTKTIGTYDAITDTITPGTYDRLSHTIPYVITVTAVDGPLSKIELTDDMIIIPSNHGGNLYHYGKLSIVGAAVEVTLPNGSSTSVAVNSASSTKPNYDRCYAIPLSGVTLNTGETATVTYTVQVDEDLLYPPVDSPERFAANEYRVLNEVNAEGKSKDIDVQGKPVETAIRFVNNILLKGGELRDDAGTPGRGDVGDTIEWNIRVGDGSSDLKGCVITDTMGPGHAIIEDTLEITLYESCDSLGNPVEPINTYKQSDSTYNLSALEYIYTNLGTGGSQFTIAVPDAGAYFVTIRYKTRITAGEQSGGYKNKVSFTYPEKGGYESEATAGVYGNHSITKSGALFEGADGQIEDGYIEYTITAQIPGSYRGKAIGIIDTMTFGDGKGKGAHVSNSLDWNNATVSIHTFTPGQDPVKGVDYECTSTQTNNQWQLNFLFPDSANFGAWSDPKWPYSADSIITVTYRIPLTATILPAGSDDAYSDAVDKALYEALPGNRVFNDACPIIGGTEYPGSRSVISWPITKTGCKTYYDDAASKWIREGEQGYKNGDFYFEADKKGYAYSVDLNPYATLEGTFSIAPDGIAPEFTDSFDSRLTLDKATVEVQRIRNDEIVDRYTVPEAAIDTNSSGKFTLRFAGIQKDGSSIDWNNMGNDFYNSIFRVNYVLLLKSAAEEELSGAVEFKNTASIGIKYKDVPSREYHSAEITVDYLKPYTAKEMEEDGSTIVDVRIEINPEGKDLANGAETITVVDTMAPNLQFIPDQMGNIVVETEVAGRKSSVTAEYDSSNNSITFAVANKAKVIVTYKAKVIGVKVDDFVETYNKVYIEGHFDREITENLAFTVTRLEGSAEGSVYGFSLQKTDADTGETLPGVEFALYMLTDLSITPPVGINMTEVHNGTTYYYLMNSTTGSDGIATFKEQHIVPGATFLLVETKPLQGYVKRDPMLVWMAKANMEQPQGTVLIEKVFENSKSGDDAGDIWSIPGPITNKAGVRLPETGGAGPKGYLLGGAAVMGLAGALAALFAAGRRRRLYEDGA